MPNRKLILHRMVSMLFVMAPIAAHAVPDLMQRTVPSTAAQPTPLRAKIEAGYAALSINDLIAAEAAFKAAAAIDPKYPGAYIGLAEVAGRRNDFALVDSLLQKAMAADPKDPGALRVWAAQQYRRGQFSDAEATFEKVIALDPASAEARADLGENYLLGLKKPKAAEDAYRAAIARDPRYTRAYLGLGGALVAQGRADEAVTVYQQAAKLAPTDPHPPYDLARLYASQVKFDQALAELSKAIAIDPGFLPAQVDRGDLLLAKNDVNGAIAAYRAGAVTVKDPALLYFRLGVALQAAQRWSEATQAYLDAVKHDPQMFAAYNNAAFIAASRKERLDDALSWAKKAIEISPKTTALYDTLGWVYRARGELDLAAKALETAVASNPKQANFRYHLGIVYAELGKKKEAVAALQAALELEDKSFRFEVDTKARLKTLTAQK